MDWGTGCYELTAAELLPAAHTVVAAAAIRAGEHVLDLGCGTGNAALLAAGPGVLVTGVDPAARLLKVARARAVDEVKAITFSLGRAESIPLPDASVDVVLSVFAVIFADPATAAAEMARVAKPSGRIVMSTGVPGSAIMDANRLRAAAVREVLGIQAPAPFPWHEHDALTSLLAPYGFGVHVTRHRIALTAPSARLYQDNTMRHHPMTIATTEILAKAGRAEAITEQVLTLLEERNESTGAFQVTTDYVVATAVRR